MKVAIDRAGRLVVPKEIRRRLGLAGGETLEIGERDGVIEITRSEREISLKRGSRGVLYAEPADPCEPLDAEAVRELIDRGRTRRA